MGNDWRYSRVSSRETTSAYFALISKRLALLTFQAEGITSFTRSEWEKIDAQTR